MNPESLISHFALVLSLPPTDTATATTQTPDLHHRIRPCFPFLRSLISPELPRPACWCQWSSQQRRRHREMKGKAGNKKIEAPGCVLVCNYGEVQAPPVQLTLLFNSIQSNSIQSSMLRCGFHLKRIPIMPPRLSPYLLPPFGPVSASILFPSLHTSSIRASDISRSRTLWRRSMAGSLGNHNSSSSSSSSCTGAYEAALSSLSSLITRRTRADGSNLGDQFDLMFHYLKMLDLDGPISQLKVIHVAGTKGKGSTCTFTESILRCCGFRTGLFTSPHLMDVRERFRIDGVEISEEKFLKYFWWCWDRLQEKTDENIPMPTYFRFLALLAFKIFSAEQVDVAVLEVGLGGKFDATNVVKAPIVCGISSLGYDHMEILGNTLGEIAGEKAGIFKEGVPAYTVAQPEEAMSVLQHRASQLGISLQIVQPLEPALLKGHTLGLQGEHQYINAGLALALVSTWLDKTGHKDRIPLNPNGYLEEEFIRGLTSASLQGRAQVVRFEDDDISPSSADLVFYLDGAHSPESMEICASWFSRAIKDKDEGNSANSRKILLFNCMSVRDPELLLPRLVNTCAQHGVQFDKAVFVPNQSQYNKLGSHSSPPAQPQQVDLSWQLSLQRVWDKLLLTADKGNEAAAVNSGSIGESSSTVIPSLPAAINWIKDYSKQNRSIRFQVLVTGSLHLVGDVLRLIKK